MQIIFDFKFEPRVHETIFIDNFNLECYINTEYFLKADINLLYCKLFEIGIKKI